MRKSIRQPARKRIREPAGKSARETVREPPFRESLYWCPECNVPLVSPTCGCKTPGYEIPLTKPYDVRPALEHDRTVIKEYLNTRFGIVTIPKILLLNKSGGIDRTDNIIANGVVFSRLTFDPLLREYTIELTPDALPFVIDEVSKGIVDITDVVAETGNRHMGGKNVPCKSDLTDGPVIVHANGRYGTGWLRNNVVKVKSMGRPRHIEMPDPDREQVIRCNKPHLKNLERHAIRFIKSQKDLRPECNVAFSGGKDSTVVRELARKAGVTDCYYIDTGMEFPETTEYVNSLEIPLILHGPDFRDGLKKNGIPAKDHRWCCEYLKLEPVRQWREKIGDCVTIQGNRWYESFARSALPGVAANPYYSGQVNLSPIRGWRAFEVFLYIWWRELPLNPLYEQGFERVGCWMCPAMLESEYETARELHPEKIAEWEKILAGYAKKEHISEAAMKCGCWRWKSLPPKMITLLKERGIQIKVQKSIKNKNRH